MLSLQRSYRSHHNMQSDQSLLMVKPLPKSHSQKQHTPISNGLSLINSSISLPEIIISYQFELNIPYQNIKPK